jgi:hypothetical protein
MRSKEKRVVKSPSRSLSTSLWSVALTLAVATNGYGGAAGGRQSVGNQSGALLGPTTYESWCHPADIPNIRLAFRYARIAANSPAFAECIRLTFSQSMVLNQDDDYTDGPYIPCANDPPTPVQQRYLRHRHRAEHMQWSEEANLEVQRRLALLRRRRLDLRSVSVTLDAP